MTSWPQAVATCPPTAGPSPRMSLLSSHAVCLSVCIFLSFLSPHLLFYIPPFFILPVSSLVWTLPGKGMTFDLRPTTLPGLECFICVVWFDIDQELIGSGLAPQSKLWLSRKCADLEGFSDVVHNREHTVKCFLFQPVFGTACTWFSHSALCPFGDIHYLFRGFKAMPQNVIKNSKLFDFLPLLFKEL